MTERVNDRYQVLIPAVRRPGPDAHPIDVLAVEARNQQASRDREDLLVGLLARFAAALDVLNDELRSDTQKVAAIRIVLTRGELP